MLERLPPEPKDSILVRIYGAGVSAVTPHLMNIYQFPEIDQMIHSYLVQPMLGEQGNLLGVSITINLTDEYPSDAQLTKAEIASEITELIAQDIDTES